MAKLLTKAEKKLAIMAGMLKGASATDMGEEYDVSPITIGAWMREQRKSGERADIETLSSVDPVVLTAVVEDIRTKARNSPTSTTRQLDKLDKDLDNLVEGVAGIEMLERGFHDTIMRLLGAANRKITDDMKVSEWTQLVNGISTLHSSIFGKGSATTINMMQQNNTSSAKVEKFKGSFRD